MIKNEDDEVFENLFCISFNPFDDYSDINNCASLGVI